MAKREKRDPLEFTIATVEHEIASREMELQGQGKTDAEIDADIVLRNKAKYVEDLKAKAARHANAKNRIKITRNLPAGGFQTRECCADDFEFFAAQGFEKAKAKASAKPATAAE